MELTERDFQLINLQLKYQQDETQEALAGFTEAYELAKKISESRRLNGWRGVRFPIVLEWIKEFARFTKPFTQGQYRTVPVTFRDGGQALDPVLVPGKMEDFAEAFVAGKIEADEVFYEFESIHPFEDGNGRVGHLLWAISTERKTGIWPETLPPEFQELKEKFGKTYHGVF